MQTTAIRTVTNSLPENEVILLTLLISKGYILFAELENKFNSRNPLLPWKYLQYIGFAAGDCKNQIS